MYERMCVSQSYMRFLWFFLQFIYFVLFIFKFLYYILDAYLYLNERKGMGLGGFGNGEELRRQIRIRINGTGRIT